MDGNHTMKRNRAFIQCLRHNAIIIINGKGAKSALSMSYHSQNINYFIEQAPVSLWFNKCAKYIIYSIKTFKRSKNNNYFFCWDCIANRMFSFALSMWCCLIMFMCEWFLFFHLLYLMFRITYHLLKYGSHLIPTRKTPLFPFFLSIDGNSARKFVKLNTCMCSIKTNCQENKSGNTHYIWCISRLNFVQIGSDSFESNENNIKC